METLNSQAPANLQDRVYTPATDFNFNFGRLVKEVDDLVQDRVYKATKEIDTSGSNNNQALLTLHTNLQKEFEDFYSKATKQAAEDAKEELIREIKRGRAIINLNNEISINVHHEDHHQFEDIMKTLLQLRKVMLIGKAGTGKTYMAAQFAERLNLPFYKYSASRDSSVHDLLGYKQPRSEEYLETTFLRAYEYGGVFLVDEFDAMSSDMALFFNGIADNSKNISIPHRDTKPVAEKHKDFYLVFSGNTWGTGSIDYTGRDFQDLALLDRFRIARHEVEYHTSFEKSIATSASTHLYFFVMKLRQALETSGSYLSTRNIEDLVTIMKTKALTDNLNLEERSHCIQVCRESVMRLIYDLDQEVKDTVINSTFNG